jgi:glycine cleavage system H lipoate-binding protein
VPETFVASGIVGISARTIVRSDTAPVDPFGVARKLLAVCPVAKVAVSVPVVVTGEPVTVNTEGSDNPTLLTVPPPVPGGA